VAAMCLVLEVSRSGFYQWLSREPSDRQRRRDEIRTAVIESHRASSEIYGYRKVHHDLQDRHVTCCRETVRRVMGELGLRSRVARRFVVTTQSDHKQPIAENLLDQQFQATRINQKWTADITYVPTTKGWRYLAVVMDLFSRRIVGWHLRDSLSAELVIKALDQAVRQRDPGPGLVHHSDRGVQYACRSFQDLLDRHGIRCSMSRRGCCYDNAPTESFFGKLKEEHLAWLGRRSPTEMEQEIFWYIEVFYHRHRKHASLGYQTPLQYEQQHTSSPHPAAA